MSPAPASSFAPCGPVPRGVAVRVEPEGALVDMARVHEGGLFEAVVDGALADLRLPAAGHRGLGPHATASTIPTATARSSAPSTPTCWPRARTTAPTTSLGARVRVARRHARRAVRGVGAQCRQRQRRRRLQRAGIGACTRCACMPGRACGRSSCPASPPARATSSRSSTRAGRARAEVGSLRPRLRGAARHRVGRVAGRLRLAGRGVA